MSRKIDSRVVEMQFDNRQFETNVKTSISTLDKLKQSLNLTGASKGLENVGTAAKNVNLSGLSGAVENVRLKFSALEVMAVTALANITNSAINTGKKIARAVWNPIFEGGRKRALNTEQAMFQFKGLGMDVESAMKSAEAAVKGTAYGLDEAAMAAAQLGASGVEAGDKMTAALTGISGVAAMTNSDYTSMAHIFTTVAGNGRLMGDQLRQLSSRGLNVAATLAEQFDTTEANIREMVSKGQISFDMFATAMYNAFGEHAAKANDTFSGSLMNVRAALARVGQTAATPIHESLRKIFVTLIPVINEVHEVLKPLIISFTEVIDIMGTKVVNFLEGLDFSNLSKNIPSITKIFSNLAKTVTSITKPISTAFRDIFPKRTAEQFTSLVETLKKFSEGLALSKRSSENLRRTFAGLFAVIDIFSNIFTTILKFIFPKFNIGARGIGASILEVTANIGDWLVNLNETIKSTDIFNKILDKSEAIYSSVAKVVKKVADVFKEFAKKISDKVKPIGLEIIHNLLERIHHRFSQVGIALSNFKKSLTDLGHALVNSGFYKTLGSIRTMVIEIGKVIGQFLGKSFGAIFEGVKSAEFETILDVMNALLTGGLIRLVMQAVESFRKSFSGIGVIRGRIIDNLNGLRYTIEAYQARLKADVLMKIAGAIAILAGSLLVLSLIDSNKLNQAVVAISVLFGELMGSMMLYSKFMGGGGIKKGMGVATIMTTMSVSILILSAALKNISSIDEEKIIKALSTILALMGGMVAVVKLLSEVEGRMLKGATNLVMFSAAILILTHAVDNLAQLNGEELAKGLTGLTVILAEVVAVTRLMGDPKRMISTGVGMIALGAAMLIFAEAVEKMGQLSWSEIGKGLTTMAGALTAITLALNFMPKGMINKATGMVVMGAALLIIAEAMSKFGDMQWGEIARGLVAMAGALTAITLALNFMPKGMVAKALGLIGIATALQIMIGPLKEMSGMSWDEIAKGLATLGGSLLIITVAMNAMTGGLAGAAAMLVMAAAIGALTPSLVILGQMDLAELGMALLSLVGVFTVVGVAGLLLAPLTPVILGLAAAIALLGVGVLAISTGLLMFSAGLTALAASGAAGAGALVIIVTSLLSLIPMVLAKIGEGIVAFAKVITNGIPAIMEAVKQIALALIQILVEITPPVVEAILTFLVTLLEQLADAVPQMVDAGMRILLGILEGITAHIRDVVVVALELISEFLRGIAEGIPGVVESAVDVVVAFLRAIGEETPRIIDAGFKMVIDFIDGLAEAIRENTPVLIESIGDLAGAIIEGLVEGLTAGIDSVVNSVKNLGSSILGKFKNVLGIASPSKEFMYLGQHIGDGLAIGIDNSIGKAANSSGKLANEIIENSKKNIEDFQDWIEEKKYYNEISLKEELDAWTLVQQRYKEGTEERKKADKEVYRLQNALVKATYQHSIDWIDEEKYYNRLSLKEELEAWQRVQSRYMKGTAERKKADREVYRLQKELTDKKIALEEEYADKVKSINDDLKRDIQSLNDDYQNALKSRADTIYKSYGLFDEVTDPERVSSDALIKNLDRQVESLNTWKNTLDDLSKRGLDPKLIEELREMGPSALGELTAISNMTDEQLSKYSNLWGEKHRLAKSQATFELEGLRIETDKQIEQLKIEADAKLAEYIETWKTRMAELSDIVVLPTDIVMSTEDTMNDSIETINGKQVEYNSAGKNIMSKLIAGIKSKDTATSKAFIQSISGCLTKIKNKYNDFYNIGKYLVQGFAAGITMYTYLAEARARAMASAAARAAEKELDIHSPSKVGFGIGSYFGLGFVNALSAYVSKSYQAGSEIAESAKNGLSEAISNITDVIENDIDTQPTIRPVLDLSDVETGTGRLNALFSRTQAMSISAGRNRTAEEIQNGGNVSGSGNIYSFTQNNYSPKALSRLEIYRQTKNQFSAMKGLVET